MKTPDEAREWLCPLARTFGTKEADAHCRGPVCAAWKWIPLSSEILTPHIKKRMAETGAKNIETNAATAWVMENREALGIPTEPTHGRCGLSG